LQTFIEFRLAFSPSLSLTAVHVPHTCCSERERGRGVWKKTIKQSSSSNIA